MSGWLGDIRGRALWVVVGCLVCQLGLGYGYLFGTLAKPILADFGWSRTLWSSARAPQLFVAALASPLVGWVTVRFGARRVLIAATLALATSFVLVSAMQSPLQLTALVILFGLSVAGLGDISVGQPVSQWVTRNRGLALGIVYTGSNLGGALVTRVGAAVAERASWREAFLGLGIGALLAILPFAVFAVRDRIREVEPDAAVGSQPAPMADPRSDLNLAGAIRTRSFWLLGFSLFTFFFYFLGMLEHLVLFLTDTGLSQHEAAGHFSNAIFLGLFSKIGFGWIADRIPYKTALLLDYGLLATSSALLLMLPDSTLLPIFVVTYGFATAARDVVYPLIVTGCFGLRYMAEVYGGLMLVLLPGGVLGPIFASAIHDRLGSYEWAFASFAALNVLAVVALIGVRDERPPLSPSGQPG